MADQPDYRGILALLFREAFEGVHGDEEYTLFAQGGEGIFDTFKDVTAEQASVKAAPDCASIFAHFNHAHYYLSLFMQGIRGEEVDLDWDKTWEKQTCTQAEWDALAAAMRKEYEEVYRYFLEGDLTGKDTALYAMGELCHACFHLGAARSLVRLSQTALP